MKKSRQKKTLCIQNRITKGYNLSSKGQHQYNSLQAVCQLKESLGSKSKCKDSAEWDKVWMWTSLTFTLVTVTGIEVCSIILCQPTCLKPCMQYVCFGEIYNGNAYHFTIWNSKLTVLSGNSPNLYHMHRFRYSVDGQAAGMMIQPSVPVIDCSMVSGCQWQDSHSQ